MNRKEQLKLSGNVAFKSTTNWRSFSLNSSSEAHNLEGNNDSHNTKHLCFLCKSTSQNLEEFNAVLRTHEPHLHKPAQHRRGSCVGRTQWTTNPWENSPGNPLQRELHVSVVDYSLFLNLFVRKQQLGMDEIPVELFSARNTRIALCTLCKTESWPRTIYTTNKQTGEEIYKGHFGMRNQVFVAIAQKYRTENHFRWQHWNWWKKGIKTRVCQFVISIPNSTMFWSTRLTDSINHTILSSDWLDSNYFRRDNISIQFRLCRQVTTVRTAKLSRGPSNKRRVCRFLWHRYQKKFKTHKK